MQLDKHHVRCASVGTEATLDLWDAFFSDGLYEPVEQDSGKFSASGGELGDSR